ncbi:SDR family NAD(P)-dependent oxidoreductase [Azospirillum sp. ST 5-10]|uniref:SDR family NAD(P)-dependent oxidoreductase n=1 Tax=unclassified Azospirillum TaxID=2630922 RepID=UPI003F4A71D6
MRFNGRTALVTAGAAGLGRGIAARLAAEGAAVMVWDRDEAALAALGTGDAGRPVDGMAVDGMAVDMTDPDAVAAAAAATERRLGRIDVLVNNAGGSLHTPQPFLEESEEDWARVFALNVDATVRTSRAVLPGMRERRYGRIVNLGSKAGRFGSLFAGANYAAAKGAVQSMTLQIAREFGPFGITCNAVCPGAILTPRVDRLLSERKTAAEREAMVADIPLRRHGRVEDVAAAVAFLAAEEAAFVTGVMLDVNGGQAMVA